MSDRDLVGYGASPPDPQWPGGARLALSFVLNYEEGGERSVLEGDPESESFLHEVVGAPPTVGRRNLNTESMFEFGSRVGFWRVHRIFAAHGLPLTVYAVGQALERNPAANHKDDHQDPHRAPDGRVERDQLSAPCELRCPPTETGLPASVRPLPPPPQHVVAGRSR